MKKWLNEHIQVVFDWDLVGSIQALIFLLDSRFLSFYQLSFKMNNWVRSFISQKSCRIFLNSNIDKVTVTVALFGVVGLSWKFGWLDKNNRNQFEDPSTVEKLSYITYMCVKPKIMDENWKMEESLTWFLRSFLPSGIRRKEQNSWFLSCVLLLKQRALGWSLDEKSQANSWGSNENLNMGMSKLISFLGISGLSGFRRKD